MKKKKCIWIQCADYEYGLLDEEHPEGVLQGTPYMIVDGITYELHKGIEKLMIFRDEQKVTTIHGWNFYDPMVEPDPYYCSIWLMAIQQGKHNYQLRELENIIIK